MAKKVNIAEYFADAMKEDAKEQLEYIGIDFLDPDPNNFYSLEGLDELAGNIELVGLQQPLRVRPGTEPGRYTIVSGHRRRSAILMIRDGGSKQFDDGVPCIVEKGEVSEAMRELRLIYANAATRTMSPADLSKQAERVELLLYRLKEEGVEFPGRMRDHVAEACRMSKSKLSRLHAIRKNLAPDLLKIFDKGEINESVAYALSKQNEDTQHQIVDNYRMKHTDYDLQEWRVTSYAHDVEAMKQLKCHCTTHGDECIHQREHLDKAWGSGYRNLAYCINGDVAICCHDCPHLASCSSSCSRCASKKDKLKKDLKAKRQSERETKAADEATRKDQHELEVAQAGLYWKRLGDALKAAGTDFWWLQDSIDRDHYHYGKGNRILCTWRLSPTDIEALLEGKPAKNEDCEIPTPFIWTSMDDDNLTGAQMYREMADLLDVSIDYLLLRTEDPAPPAEREKERDRERDAVPDSGTEAEIGPEWHRDPKPPREGRYLCLVDMNTTTLHEQRCDWRDGQWYAFGMPLRDLFTVVAWWPLPPEAPHPEWWHGMDDDAEEEEA